MIAVQMAARPSPSPLAGAQSSRAATSGVPYARGSVMSAAAASPVNLARAVDSRGSVAGFGMSRRAAPAGRRGSAVRIAADGKSAARFESQSARLKSLGVNTYKLGGETLTEGSYGEDVRELQKYLQGTGYFYSEYGCTAYYGKATEKAVMDWQKDVGVAVTGSFGDDSRDGYIKVQEEVGAELKRSPSLNYQSAMEKVLERRRTAKSGWGGFGTKKETVAGQRAAPRLPVPGAGRGRVAEQLGGKGGLIVVGVAFSLALLQALKAKAKQNAMDREMSAAMEADRKRQADRWASAIATDRLNNTPTPKPKKAEENAEEKVEEVAEAAAEVAAEAAVEASGEGEEE